MLHCSLGDGANAFATVTLSKIPVQTPSLTFPSLLCSHGNMWLLMEWLFCVGKCICLIH